MTRSRPLLSTVLFAGLLLFGSVASIRAQTADRFALLDASRFWIQGTTTVNSFTCHVEAVRGQGRVPRVAPSAVPVSLEDSASLAVPVHHFDCGNDRMSADLKETLEADTHPTIRFHLQKVEAVEPPTPSTDWYRLTVLGTLTVAGTDRLVRVSAWGRPVNASPGDVYRVSGCKEIQMTYFGIDPPSKFMNLVKVRDQIEVHFDLLVETPRTVSPTLASHSLSQPPQCHDE